MFSSVNVPGFLWLDKTGGNVKRLMGWEVPPEGGQLWCYLHAKGSLR